MIEFLRKVTNIKLDEPMSAHTTFKVGGAADIFAEPKGTEELQGIIKICQENKIPYFILGNGSNLLVKDKGVRGVVVSLLGLNEISLIEDEKIHAEAGVLLKDLAEFAYENSLSGFEFLHGIPGSVGGGVFMNAGAYDGEVKDVFVSANCVDSSGTLFELDSAKMDFAYRKSSAQTAKLIIANAVFRGKNCTKSEIDNKMQDLKERRNSKQPLDMASAGSTFKRPPGHFAGKLIMDAGLRGHQIGGAQISEKHCGFIINKGNATAKDILDLIAHTQKTVNEKFDIVLETEVKVIGE